MNHLPRSQETINVQNRDRVRVLERKSGGNHRPQTIELASFNWDFPAVPTSYAALSGWPVILGGQVTEVRCTAGTAASGASTFKVRVNGTQVGSTLTFPAATTNTTLYLGNVRVPAGTLLHLEPVTIGTGLLGFTGVVAMKG